MDEKTKAINYQKKYGLKDREMAQLLKVTCAWWNFIKNGKVEMSDKLKYRVLHLRKKDIFLLPNYTQRIEK